MAASGIRQKEAAGKVLVYAFQGKYQAHIRRDGKRQYVGLYKSKAAAVAAVGAAQSIV